MAQHAARWARPGVKRWRAWPVAGRAGREIASEPMAHRPDPLETTPPAFGDEAVRRILRDRFGVEATSLTPLAGERDQNFRVDTADGRRLLFKISNPADGLSTIEMQTAALRHIERVDPGLPVMRPLPDVVGEPWVEVRGPDGRNHPAPDYEILWDLTHAAKLRMLLNYVSDAARRAQVARVLDRFETRVEPVLPTLRAQVIHGDMSLDNVLLGDDLQISGIVDFGDMTHAPLVCDLAVSVADVLHGRGDAIEAAEVLIGGYVSVTPLEDEEAGLLADLVATRLATEVTVAAWHGGLFPDNAAYTASGEPGARAFLDTIEAMVFD